MKDYIWRRRADGACSAAVAAPRCGCGRTLLLDTRARGAGAGIHVLNVAKTWEKIQLAARVIVAIENPQVCVAWIGLLRGCSPCRTGRDRDLGAPVRPARGPQVRALHRRAGVCVCVCACRSAPAADPRLAFVVLALTPPPLSRAQSIAGRFTPGTFTNQITKQVCERFVLVCMCSYACVRQSVSECAWGLRRCSCVSDLRMCVCVCVRVCVHVFEYVFLRLCVCV
jgi:hypothetical protein